MSISQILHDKFMDVFEHVTQAFRSIDNDHAYIHQKKMFNAFHKGTITAGGTLAFGFKTPATGYVHYRLAGIKPSADKLDKQIFEDATFTATTGTLLVASNRNRNAPIASVVELRVAPTFTVNGTLLEGFSDFLPGTTSVGQSNEGTTGESKDEIVLKQNTTYRFLLTNGSAAANTVGIQFRWYEETYGE